MKTTKEFVHLNVHSHYSILDGCATIKQIVDAAVENRMPGIAITDRGNMFGVMEFFEYVNHINKARQEKGEKPFKPIIGCELYVVKNGNIESEGINDFRGYLLTILAKNRTGYKNLIKVVTNAWTEGFFVVPRTSRKDLEKYHEGLIVLSGGLGSEVYANITNNDMSALEETIKWHKQVFGDDFYLEMRRNADYTLSKDSPNDLMLEQEYVNQVLIQKSKELGIKVVCTNDVHYVNPENSVVYNIQRCIAVGKNMEEFDKKDPLRFRWLRSKREMWDLFSDIPYAISNTIEIFDKVETYSIHHSPIMPPFAIPEGFNSDADYLKHLTYTKARGIYGDSLPEEIDDRLQFELEIIRKNGGNRYFLFMQDVVNTAEKELGALVGPGRGSAAGSLVAYCLGITKIDPLKHDLLFERFICPDRQMPPDIDLDFDEEGQTHVIEWIEKKYGKEFCAHIISYSKFSPRKAFDSVAKVQQLPKDATNAINNAIPLYLPYYPKTMEGIIECTPKLKKLIKSSDITMQNAICNTKVLDGTIKGMNIHACGLIVSETPICNWVPVCVQNDPDVKGKLVRCTQYDGWNIESSGLIKFDFLSLNTLSQLKMICERIKVNMGRDFDIENIPLDDKKTLELFQQGDTEDIFQYETQGMRKYLRELHPTTFEDLILLNAMFRPGPIEYLPLLIKRKKGKSKIRYAIPNMERYLHETYGILVYQEQLMSLSRLIADFSRSESDTLRKAMGKKKEDKLAELKPKFIEGGMKNGYKKSTLERIWKDWERKGLYAFNKAHAVCYSWLAYQMAFLKANYPEEFISVMSNSDLE